MSGSVATQVTEECPHVLTFDTEHFQIRIAQTDHPDVDKWAAENAVGCLFMLVDSSDVEELQAALARGWLLTDIRVELALRPLRIARNVVVREATDRDLPRLVEIARSAHRITRFYADPHFDDERCDDLYEAWIRNSCAGWAEKVLVSGDDPTGYCTLHLDDEEASIGLIAVAEEHRGKGLGKMLCRNAINMAHGLGAKRLSTVTQGRNVAALRMFETAGFRVERTGLWLHRWFV